ncbi:siderophore-interacting protein [Gryllotalpicola reticulitermitis]|uniref:Siderophore-interacting protein n=1 Tax=Gryllotalpicola reticulitermitis TaxID=1184153 RepID=A0ABV8Q9L6_9MICO
MTEQLTSGRAVRPRQASVRRLAVHATTQPSPGFVRITLASTGDGFEDDFEYQGFDQWFRLFLPRADGRLVLPDGPAEGWYSRWLGMDESVRPEVRNYTIRDARSDGGRWLLDVDFVIHRSASGTVDGTAAGWAVGATVGDEVGLLDQGRIFNVPAGEHPITVIADESGLPGVEGIARALGDRAARYLIEVTDAADIRTLSPSVPDADVEWLVRPHRAPAGSLAIAAFDDAAIDASSYLYAVGEAKLALAARRAGRAAGVDDRRIDFCAYWRADRDSSFRAS